jgi:formyltetrahydrofolate deformylase
VSAVTAWLASRSLNIAESQQFGDVGSGRFFMRVRAEATSGVLDVAGLRTDFAPLASELQMDSELHSVDERPRLLILVSRFGHCLNDLLYRYRIGALGVEIPAIVSNHADFASLAAGAGVPFQHLPVSDANRAEQEAAILSLVEAEGIDLVVLARYMQILSPRLVSALEGRAINIHHGLLPSFKGANPYRQAHDRGVKVIGATAHYVTATLDEGPIIEQAVAPVTHAASVEQLAGIGRDLECAALARAVQWHVERRVLLNGARTVVFS